MMRLTSLVSSASDRHRHRQISLAGARGPNAKNHVMAFDSVNIKALVQTFRRDRFLPEAAGTARFRQTLQAGVGVLADDAQKAFNFRIFKARATLHQRRVLLHHALGAAHVPFVALNLQGVVSQTGGDLETSLEKLQVPVIGAH